MASQSSDPAKILSDMLSAGQELMHQFAGAPVAPPGAQAEPSVDFTETSKQFAEMQQQYLKQVTNFWSGMLGMPVQTQKTEDKRFASEAWRDDPRFSLVRGAYQAYTEFLEKSVESAEVDDKTRGQLRFAARQFADAMSPTNFFATNPDAMQMATETGGQSLTEGMKLFFQDLAKGRISMTDETAFEVGKNLAVTPGAVVFENDLIQLLQYNPSTKQVFERPLVIIPPCINRFYILDLQPENSFVRYAVEQGHTVFMVSWRSINPELGHLTWDDYVQSGVMKAIDVAREITETDRVNTLGFCVGGTLLASALAVLAHKDQHPAVSLTLLTNMLDQSDPGEIGLLISEQSVAAREAAIGKGGVFHGKELAFVFSSLRANDLIWQYVVNNYLKGKAPPAFDLLYWNSDASNLPGPMFCWYIRNLYLENAVRIPGKTVQCGVPVDLSTITVPAYLYASREDHIVPWKSAYASRGLLSGETTFVLGASGHIAGVINPASKNKRNYWADGAGKDDPEQWLASAKGIPGSWWPHWSAWLAKYAGEQVPARNKLGSKEYSPIEPAPGRYIKEKAD
ncbi:MAG TPA: class I poly(R)-hydroxyalkanoic acid synthase [Burkholderiales bacterium]|nr:class I poly(R)-hydroxyalkanoic acid synthase [Burkholderiales bacterium]